MKKNLNLNTKKRKGFSLMELIIAVVIIGILSGVGIGAFVTVQNKANMSAFESNIKLIKQATAQYALLNDNKLPTKAEQVDEFIDGGLKAIEGKPANATYELSAAGEWTFKYKNNEVKWSYSGGTA